MDQMSDMSEGKYPLKLTFSHRAVDDQRKCEERLIWTQTWI